LASKFGGGGHIHAAGARVNVGIDEAKSMVLAAIAT
jgi:nanoRNase/pAp phosphatase (c-di-AMP/oligoRNAs hydrolase)